MKPAAEFHQVTNDLVVWQAYEPEVKAELTACAVRSPHGWVFIDPIPLEVVAMGELTASTRVVGIVLTNGNHERAAAVYRERFSAPVFAHSEAAAEFSLKIDEHLAGGATVLETLRVITIQGAAKGEIALHGTNTVIVGDALINLEPYGFTFLPDKYCLDAKQMRGSLRKLLQFPFQVMTFAHGLPLVSGAKQRLEQLLQ
jgi:hypothetical protein